MTTKRFLESAVRWAAIATGVSLILAALLLLLMYSVNPSFGRLNDILNAILGIASGVLASMLFPQHHARSPLGSRIALVLAVVGVFFTLAGSVLIIFDFTGFVLIPSPFSTAFPCSPKTITAHPQPAHHLSPGLPKRSKGTVNSFPTSEVYTVARQATARSKKEESAACIC